jgi:hypothetical protein
LDGVDPKVHELDAVHFLDADAVGVQGGGTGAGIDLRFDRVDAEVRQCDPFAPADGRQGLITRPAALPWRF